MALLRHRLLIRHRWWFPHLIYQRWRFPHRWWFPHLIRQRWWFPHLLRSSSRHLRPPQDYATRTTTATATATVYTGLSKLPHLPSVRPLSAPTGNTASANIGKVPAQATVVSRNGYHWRFPHLIRQRWWFPHLLRSSSRHLRPPQDYATRTTTATATATVYTGLSKLPHLPSVRPLSAPTGNTASANIGKVPAQATAVSRNGCNLPRKVLIIMGFYVRFGIGPLRYSAPLTRRRRPTRNEPEFDRAFKVILFFAAFVVGTLLVEAAIAHPAAALFIGCTVVGVVLLGMIGVRERRRMNAKAARSELGDRHAQPAGSEVTPPDAPPQLLPAKRAESDPVAVAAARVAEKWRELEQLDSRRIEAGVDLESEMQRVFQDGLDITTEIFGNISDRVISEVKTGGRRARIGNRALPHVENAMAAMEEALVACKEKRGIYEGMDKIDAVFSPLHLAYNCLVAE